MRLEVTTVAELARGALLVLERHGEVPLECHVILQLRTVESREGTAYHILRVSAVGLDITEREELRDVNEN